VLFWSSLYIGINILLAYIDSVLISKGERIYHGLNGAVYIMLMIPAYMVTKSIFLIVALLLIRRLVFDISLNLFRGLPYDYTSDTTTSIIDRLLYDVQEVLGIVYYVLLIAAIIFFLKISNIGTIFVI
jgi:hypothetical protein